MSDGSVLNDYIAGCIGGIHTQVLYRCERMEFESMLNNS